jgi:two-component system, NarL family, sensor histidine kinase UhpB
MNCMTTRFSFWQSPWPLAAWCWVLLWMCSAPAAAQVLTFKQVWQVEETVAQGRFPAPAVKVEVALPDSWPRSRPELANPAWYQLTVTPAQRLQWPEDTPLAMFIERACGQLTVQVDGATVLGGVSSPCGQPVLLHLPAALWKVRAADGNHQIDIRLDGQPLWRVASSERVAALSQVQVGPAAALQSRYDWAFTRQVVLPQFASIALVLVGAFVIVLGWWRLGDAHLVFFGLTSLFWGVLHARLWWRLGDLPAYDAELLIICLVPMVAFAAIQFLLSYAGWRSRPVEAALLVQCLVSPATVLASGPDRVNGVASFWYWLIVLELLAAGVFFFHSLRQAKRRDLKAASVGLAFMFVTLLLEVAVLKGWLTMDWRAVSHVAWPVMALAMGLWLMYRQSQALDHAEVEQRSLESRLREATDAIERNYEQMAELKVEKVTQQERKRIAADLHDDLGAKLLTIVHTSGDERISTLAREALEEMRLSVRGLTGKPVRLIDALGDWRAEVVSRLSQTGVEGDWQAPTEELPQTLSARAYVQTTRILREAVNNIIKHSGASRCAIKCVLVDGDFQLIIQDNGKGIPMEMDGKLDRGHGMTSMKHRAKQMQGQCLVESGPGYGTLIRLTLPLEKQLVA